MYGSGGVGDLTLHQHMHSYTCAAPSQVDPSKGASRTVHVTMRPAECCADTCFCMLCRLHLKLSNPHVVLPRFQPPTSVRSCRMGCCRYHGTAGVLCLVF
jgi:hypothetical protein